MLPGFGWSVRKKAGRGNPHLQRIPIPLGWPSGLWLMGVGEGELGDTKGIPRETGRGKGETGLCWLHVGHSSHEITQDGKYWWFKLFRLPFSRDNFLLLSLKYVSVLGLGSSLINSDKFIWGKYSLGGC